jgi:thioredoxin 1
MGELKELTNDTFAEEVAKHDFAVVDAFASWCGTCRLFMPKFRKIAEADSTETGYFKINAENAPDFRAKVQIANLPYFAVFKNGEFVAGTSTAKEETLQEFIEQHRG